jgi:hypothetical protein
MTVEAPTPAGTVVKSGPRTFGAGYLFGVPLGDLGWFQTALMSAASGFLAFFAATFLGIMTILIWNATTHGTVDFAVSYKWIGLPVGLLVLATASLYLGSLWVKRMVRKG